MCPANYKQQVHHNAQNGTDMSILNLSSNSKAYVFEELHSVHTAIYLIETDQHLFLIDTFCGSGYLEEVRKDIAALKKPLYVINSHHHWDHIWGNCAFKHVPIIAHTLCRKEEVLTWETQYQENIKFAKGDCTCTLPNITFDRSLVFEEDGIELFHTPGHTIDSISIYDRNYKILYAGDNLELPIVYVQQPDLDLYIHTLDLYLAMDVDKYTGSHELTVTRENIMTIRNYLSSLKHGEPLSFENSYLQGVHHSNLEVLRKAVPTN